LTRETTSGIAFSSEADHNMKAWLSTAPGGPETLNLMEIPAPAAREGEVLVRTRAVGLNFPDTLIIQDKYQLRPQRPFAPGGELAGTVVATGEGVKGFRQGDRVVGVTLSGALMEQVAVNASRCAVIPDDIDFASASVFPFVYGTVWHALVERGDIKPPTKSLCSAPAAASAKPVARSQKRSARMWWRRLVHRFHEIDRVGLPVISYESCLSCGQHSDLNGPSI
jgi:hypothetical protein